jgi:hypothetical protein
VVIFGRNFFAIIYKDRFKRHRDDAPTIPAFQLFVNSADEVGRGNHLHCLSFFVNIHVLFTHRVIKITAQWGVTNFLKSKNEGLAKNAQPFFYVQNGLRAISRANASDFGFSCNGRAWRAQDLTHAILLKLLRLELKRCWNCFSNSVPIKEYA